MKLVLIVVLSLLLFSCVRVENSTGEDALRYIVLAYRYGYGLSKEALEQIAESTDYDDEVLAYYEYFRTGSLPKLIETKAWEVYDDRVLNVLKDSLSVDGTSPATLVDLFDKPVVVSDWNVEEGSARSELIERVKTLLIDDWKNRGFFYQWCEKYSIDVNEEDVLHYAEFLAKVCESSSNIKLKRSSQIESGFFAPEVDLSTVPTELVLAICYRESRFFPAAFRCEIENETVRAVSIGLGQILADVDSLLSVDGKQDLYTFELLNLHYFENLFEAVDLAQIKASVLFCCTMLALLIEKFR
ncbi:hypothetical protein AS159_05740 [Thermotoga sp. Ku-13t]|uniref:hypothetical protein n=1 Tax=Thermotoga sp. Ku-13t TaxID=1755813 RepID=UPI0013EDCC2E|nr:hypothetical protein [Thermotoga sp. Ku-13t]KAF2957897.1 hypothetical protein AS159_05740 [Thermotoga sp. Ku-13t]